MRALRLVAGPSAAQQLREHGLRQQDVSVLVGASGGPKWFCLYGLDQYLFGEFFRDRQTPLHLIGSSAGAWRFACFAQRNPVAASQRFAEAYHSARFPAKASVADITRISRGILDVAVPDADTAQSILDNPVIKLNLVVARARGPLGTDNQAALAAGLLVAASANAVHRRTLGGFFERVLFHAPDSTPPFHHINDLPTRRVPLSADNLREAIMASGSIPLALSAVRDIPGAGPGRYYDGGVTDYHFDIPFSDDGLVLYPHFYPHITPGWFDKAIKWRRANPRHYDNVLILCPSDEWVASLPGGKIPDRKDFARMDDDTRIRVWRQVLDRSQELAEELHALVEGRAPLDAALASA